eukprot:gene22182-biopygen19231
MGRKIIVPLQRACLLVQTDLKYNQGPRTPNTYGVGALLTHTGGSHAWAGGSSLRRVVVLAERSSSCENGTAKFSRGFEKVSVQTGYFPNRLNRHLFSIFLTFTVFLSFPWCLWHHFRAFSVSSAPFIPTGQLPRRRGCGRASCRSHALRRQRPVRRMQRPSLQPFPHVSEHWAKVAQLCTAHARVSSGTCTVTYPHPV